MKQAPVRIDSAAHLWFYEQHRLLWKWIAKLSLGEITRIISERPDYPPDYALKAAWPGWGERWGLEHGSFACEIGGNTRNRCFNCPLGCDYCQQKDKGYQKFLASIRAGDIVAFKSAALEVHDAWEKPKEPEKTNRWW